MSLLGAPKPDALARSTQGFTREANGIPAEYIAASTRFGEAGRGCDFRGHPLVFGP